MNTAFDYLPILTLYDMKGHRGVSSKLVNVTAKIQTQLHLTTEAVIVLPSFLTTQLV